MALLTLSSQPLLRECASPFSEQTPYAGTDPSLVLWVRATLVETAPSVFQRVVSPLNSAQKRVFYQAREEWGLRLGISRDDIPAT